MPYRSVDYTALYTDADADADAGTQTLTDPDGSFRQRAPERWLLWLMGVASAGAICERGRHAIAFVGERHSTIRPAGRLAGGKPAMNLRLPCCSPCSAALPPPRPSPVPPSCASCRAN